VQPAEMLVGEFAPQANAELDRNLVGPRLAVGPAPHNRLAHAIARVRVVDDGHPVFSDQREGNGARDRRFPELSYPMR
jgi:hypothetical protein